MAHSKNAQRFFKQLGKRTSCHPYGIKGGAHGVVAPHWLAYSPELRPLRSTGPLGLAALMLRSRKVDDTDETETDTYHPTYFTRTEADATVTIDPCDCPEPSCLPTGPARTYGNGRPVQS